MMNERIEIFFKKLTDDKEFGEKIFKEENKAEDVQVIAKEAGIELTLEEINEAKELIMKAFDAQNEGELSEEDLENVAGGVIATSTIIGVVGAVAAVATVAVGGAGVIAAASGAIGRGFQKIFAGW